MYYCIIKHRLMKWETYSPHTPLWSSSIPHSLFFFFLMPLVYHRQPTSVRALKPLSLSSCPLHPPTHFSQTPGGFFRFQGGFFAPTVS